MLKNKELKGHRFGRRWLIAMDQPAFHGLSNIGEDKPVDRALFHYIKDSAHEEMFRKYLFSVKESLYIATSDFKNVYFDGVELASILDSLVDSGVRVIVKCMHTHGHEAEQHKFELIECSRNHMKLFIFDEKTLYIGSANLTAAAIGRNQDSWKAFNYEAGILTTDSELINQALEHFKQSAEHKECKICKRKSCKFRG